MNLALEHNTETHSAYHGHRSRDSDGNNRCIIDSAQFLEAIPNLLGDTPADNFLLQGHLPIPSVQKVCDREIRIDIRVKDRTARTLLRVLRHVPEEFDLQMDADGWVDLLEVGCLLSSIPNWGSLPNRREVHEVIRQLDLGDRVQVSTNSCRATYGHSTNRFAPEICSRPYARLFHGTSSKALRLISCFGLEPYQRRFVQLTTDLEYAKQVANTSSNAPNVLTIEFATAIKAGVRFYPTGTHVWLATAIPPDCIKLWSSDLDSHCEIDSRCQKLPHDQAALNRSADPDEFSAHTSIGK